MEIPFLKNGILTGEKVHKLYLHGKLTLQSPHSTLHIYGAADLVIAIR